MPSEPYPAKLGSARTERSETAVREGPHLREHSGPAIDDLARSRTAAQNRAGDVTTGAKRALTKPAAIALTFLHAIAGGGLILLGLAAIVLPGPFTVPPIVLGLWILSRRFNSAAKLLSRLEPSWSRLRDRYRNRHGRLVLEGVISVFWVAAVVWIAHRFDFPTRLFHWLGA